jgi:hypothetical protein
MLENISIMRVHYMKLERKKLEMKNLYNLYKNNDNK